MGGHSCHGTHAEAREQLRGIFLPSVLCGFQGLTQTARVEQQHLYQLSDINSLLQGTSYKTILQPEGECG